MANEFQLVDDLRNIKSYPSWAQDIVGKTEEMRRRAANHELFARMQDGSVAFAVMQRFLTGMWPVIYQFPQFLSANLVKTGDGLTPAEIATRRYLGVQIAAKESDADHWLAWAAAYGVGAADMSGRWYGAADALALWCLVASDKASLPAAIAATSFAVEGCFSTWARGVHASPRYSQSLTEAHRSKALRWVELHADNDAVSWQALQIIAMQVGRAPSATHVFEIERAIRASYLYSELAFNEAMRG